MMRSLIYSLFLLVLYSCDTSTHKWTSFEADNSGDSLTIVSWNDSSECEFYTSDTTINFNSIQLHFYKDNSKIESFSRPIYTYLYSEKDKLDSVQVNGYFFDLDETDSRVTDNDSIQAVFRLNKKNVHTEILYKKITESTMLDRIPLPKLH